MKKYNIDDKKKITFYFTLVTLIATLTKAYIWYIPIYLLFLIYLLFKDNTIRKIIKPFKTSKSGSEGEYEVERVLSSLGYSKYIVLNNINLKGKNKEAQIDHLVISDYGIFNIETKNYSGTIKIDYEGNITQKTKHNKGDITSVLSQCKYHRNVLIDLVGNNIPIYDVIVIANKNTNIIRLGKIDIDLITIHELHEYIRNKEVSEVVNRQSIYSIIEENRITGSKLLNKKIRYTLKNHRSLIRYTASAMVVLTILFSIYDGNILKLFGINNGSAKVSNNLIGKEIELSDIESMLKFKDFEERDLGVFMTLENDKNIDNYKIRFNVVDIKGDSYMGMLYGDIKNNERTYLFQGVKSLGSIYKLKISYIGNDGFTKQSEFNFKELKQK
ncbi:MAG: nuclease-related domain-containing protein [Clostridium sp.]